MPSALNNRIPIEIGHSLIDLLLLNMVTFSISHSIIIDCMSLGTQSHITCTLGVVNLSFMQMPSLRTNFSFLVIIMTVSIQCVY